MKHTKFTHHAKTNESHDIARSLVGDAARDIFWLTFKLWPSDISWTVHHPKDPEALDKWLVSERFTLEATWLINPGVKSDNSWEEKQIELFVNKRKKMMITRSLTGEKIIIRLLFPAELMGYALAMQKLIALRIGTTLPPRGRVNLLGVDHGDFSLIGMSIPKPEVDLGLNYGTSFVDVDNDIRAFINGRESGLVLLHGISGSGKSTYIYSLIHGCQQKMIFIPNNVIPAMANPDFITFLLEEAKDSVLIVEDAEKVLLKRGGPGDAGVSTLLNITDGILGKIIRCKVICTFNIERSELDDALLRKGRLRREHVFDKLPVEDANKLFDHLGKERRTDEPLILADIYNDEGGRETNKTTVGFKT